jgi:DNA adenine methylase
MKLRRSPLFYVGDKFKLAPQLLPLFPQEIGLFVEPFAGGGSISLNVDAKAIVLNDSNHFVASLHKWLQSQESIESLLESLQARIKQAKLKSSYFGDTVPDELKKAYPKTYFAQQNKVAYEAFRSEFNKTDKSDMLDFFVLLIFGFNRMIRTNSLGEFNVPVGNVDFNSNVAKALEGYLAWAKSMSVKTFSLDYEKCVSKLKLKPDSFLYFDPPYLIAQTEYNKGWTTNDEERFLDYLDSLSQRGHRWALSNVLTYRGMNNELLERWSQKYDVVNLSANYINYHDNADKKPGEVLVRNYD